ncbi:MAG: hypothetical protein ABIG63_11495 [Chloroflexota bacterium]
MSYLDREMYGELEASVKRGASAEELGRIRWEYNNEAIRLMVAKMVNRRNHLLSMAMSLAMTIGGHHASSSQQ